MNYIMDNTIIKNNSDHLLCSCGMAYLGRICRQLKATAVVHCLEKLQRNNSRATTRGVVVQILGSFWVPIIVWHLIFRVPKKGP